MAPACCFKFSYQRATSEPGHTGFSCRLWRRAQLELALSNAILARCGWEVCDGAHGLFVMKTKSEGPHKGSLEGHPHEKKWRRWAGAPAARDGWDDRGVGALLKPAEIREGRLYSV